MTIYDKDKKKPAGAGGTIPRGDFTPTGSGAVVSPKATPTVAPPVRITNPVGSNARTKPQGAGRNAGSINAASPRTTPNVAGGWSGTTTPQTPVKTPSQLYDQYRDDPMVDQYMEEMRKQAAAPAADDMDEEEQAAYDEAVYNSLVLGKSSGKADSPYRTAAPVDEATEAARRAQADAYDAARRGAGGAGTSYAALSGVRAYNDAYEGVREREAAEAEALRERDEAEIQEQKEQDTLAFATVMEAYNGTNEATLMGYLNRLGYDDEEAWEMIDTVARDWKAQADRLQAEEDEDAKEADLETARDRFYDNLVVWDRNNMSREELDGLIREARYMGLGDADIEAILDLFPSVGEAKSAEVAVNSEGEEFDEEQVKVIYAMLMIEEAGDEDAGVAPRDLSSAKERASIMGDMEGLGYDRADIVAAFDAWDNRNKNTEKAGITEAADKIVAGLDSGEMDDLYTYSYNPDTKSSYTAEEWAEKDESDRAAALLDGMGEMLKRGEIDKSVYLDQLIKDAMIVAEDVKAGEYSYPADAVDGICDIILRWEEKREDGLITAKERDEMAIQLVMEMGKTGFVGDELYIAGESMGTLPKENKKKTNEYAQKYGINNGDNGKALRYLAKISELLAYQERKAKDHAEVEAMDKQIQDEYDSTLDELRKKYGG